MNLGMRTGKEDSCTLGKAGGKGVCDRQEPRARTFVKAPAKPKNLRMRLTQIAKDIYHSHISYHHSKKYLGMVAIEYSC